MGARRPGGAALGTGWRGAGEAELLLGEVRRGNRVEARRMAAAANRVGGEHQMASGRVQLLLLPALTEARSGGGAGEAAALGR